MYCASLNSSLEQYRVTLHLCMKVPSLLYTATVSVSFERVINTGLTVQK